MTSIQDLQPNDRLSVTIAASGSLSGASSAITPAGATPIGLWLPSTWSAAKVSLQVSRDGTNWSIPVDPATGAFFETGTITPASGLGVFVPLDPVMMKGARYIKVQSGTKASATTQSSEATIAVDVSPVF